MKYLKTYRTGLAVMLAGLFFLFAVPVQNSQAEDKLPLETDSSLIERHILEVITGQSIEEFSEHSFNAHLTRSELDSILWEDERMKFESAEMIWAPDSTFRICVIEMQGCGAYCNPSWHAWLHFNDGSGYVLKDADFVDILSIDKMPDGKYLIAETSYGRSGVYGCRSYSVSLISFERYQIKYHRFPNTESTSGATESFGVGFCSYYGDTTQCTLRITKQNEIVYHYAEDAGLYTIPDSIFVYDGVLEYADSAFVVKSHRERKIKFVEWQ